METMNGGSTRPGEAAAVLVMPMPATGGGGPVAVWITAAAWTRAARDRVGNAWLVTPSGVLSPEEALAIATRPSNGNRPKGEWRRLVPAVLKTMKKDLRDAARAYRFHGVALHGPWEHRPVSFVWQHHELFHRAGFVAAKRFGCPLILFVDAPAVWETRKWGVTRPGWGRALEAFAERPQLRAADVVACVSDEVADELARFGVEKERIIVTPCSADVARFSPESADLSLRERLGLASRFVVGWIGSFRRFHGVDLLLESYQQFKATVPEAALLLVGDGSERGAMMRHCRERGIEDVVFTGTVPHSEVPDYIAAMDVAAVVDPGHQDFHYSPLKLKEYMSCGRAVVAPMSGEMRNLLRDGENALVVPAGSSSAVADALQRLYRDDDLRRSLGARARQQMVSEGDWGHQLDRALALARRLPRNPLRG